MSDTAIGESEIKEYIEDYSDLDISYNKLFTKEKNTFTAGDQPEEVLMIGDSILKKYKKDLDDIIETRTFTYEEQRKYYYNPWRLSYDMYGSVEYWFLILEANNLYSATEFSQETIKVYDSSLPALVEAILALEEEFIDANEEEIDNDDLGTTPEMLEDIDDEDEDDDETIYEEE